jgi:hypothetical protein
MMCLGSKINLYITYTLEHTPMGRSISNCPCQQFQPQLLPYRKHLVTMATTIETHSTCPKNAYFVWFLVSIHRKKLACQLGSSS